MFSMFLTCPTETKIQVQVIYDKTFMTLWTWLYIPLEYFTVTYNTPQLVNRASFLTLIPNIEKIITKKEHALLFFNFTQSSNNSKISLEESANFLFSFIFRSRSKISWILRITNTNKGFHSIPLESILQSLILRWVMFNISDNTEQKTFQQCQKLRWVSWGLQVVEQLWDIVLPVEKLKQI